MPPSLQCSLAAAFRYLCAAGAALNITALMAANLAGFVLGLDGLKGVNSCSPCTTLPWGCECLLGPAGQQTPAATVCSGLAGSEVALCRYLAPRARAVLLPGLLKGHIFVAAMLATFFSAANIMFWLRQWESAARQAKRGAGTGAT